MTTFDVIHARDDARQRRVAALHGLNEDAGGREYQGRAGTAGTGATSLGRGWANIHGGRICRELLL